MSALGVKSGHLQCKTACPLYPQKRTYAVQLSMSAMGQKRTLVTAIANRFSATYPASRDMCGCGGAAMRIAVFGTGGAGGYFGAQLALAGETVIFIARGDHLRAIKAAGLRLETPSGETVIGAEATDNPAEAGPADVVLVGVKAWQVTDAANAMRPLVGPGTVVVPLQNGVEAAGELAAVVGPHALGGMCGTLSFIAGPGHVRSMGGQNFIKFGELDNKPSERVERLRQ